MLSFSLALLCVGCIEERFMKRKQRSSLLFGWQDWFNSLPHYRFIARMMWRNGLKEKWTLGGTDASENGRSSSSHHHPPKMDVLPKTVLQIILAAKAAAFESLKQQRRPLPSRLYKSWFFGGRPRSLYNYTHFKGKCCGADYDCYTISTNSDKFPIYSEVEIQTDIFGKIPNI